MFGKKKEKRVQEFINGVPQQVPALEVPPPIPPMPEVSEEVQTIDAECVICFDYGFYADNVGVWHRCPRCNPVVEREPAFDTSEKVRQSKAGSSKSKKVKR